MPRAKRANGAGAVYIKHASYYARWLTPSGRTNRRLGPVRRPGSSVGLTRTQAEKRLRVLTADDAVPVVHDPERTIAVALVDVLREPADDGGDPAVYRVGRLGGVLLKQPFAGDLTQLTEPSPYTGAWRAWPLLDEPAFAAALQKDCWRAHTLLRIHADLATERSYHQESGIYALAFEAQAERGFFGFFARAAQRYLCGDPNVREKVQQALADAQGGGAQVAGRLTPETIVGIGGAALSVELVQAVPELGVLGAPLIATLVVILYRIGLEGFCDWADGISTNDAEG